MTELTKKELQAALESTQESLRRTQETIFELEEVNAALKETNAKLTSDQADVAGLNQRLAQQDTLLRNLQKARAALAGEFDALKAAPVTEEAAISALEQAGFHHFVETKIEDCREASTKRRVRTFRNSGRYAVCLAKR